MAYQTLQSNEFLVYNVRKKEVDDVSEDLLPLPIVELDLHNTSDKVKCQVFKCAIKDQCVDTV